MRNLFVFLSCFLVMFDANAQTDSIYETLVAKAGLLHLQKDYYGAIELYKEAFAIRSPDELAAYKAAGMYALAGNTDKAFHYLQLALDSGWTEADWLIFDPYFDSLRRRVPKEWEALVQEALVKEKNYSRSLQLPDLRREINRMTLTDQQLRYQRAQADDDSVSAVIDQQINKSDLNNLHRANEIIQKYGWPGISQIGKDGQNNLWLIVQHADHDVIFQQNVLGEMEKLKDSKELNVENYAFLFDRVKCNLNYRQLYGTQVIWTNSGKASGFRSIREEHRVNERRKAMGMQPLQIYALNYGFDYQVPTAVWATKRDSLENANVTLLMDSAKHFFAKKEFHKTYDYYNNASTFQGGMTSADNLEAAIIFARIAAVEEDEKYPSIALDFLYLLFLRNELSKSQLLAEPVFKVLYEEQRWQDITQNL